MPRLLEKLLLDSPSARYIPSFMLSKLALNEYLAKADITINGNKPYDVHVHDPKLYKKLLLDPSMGAGESYMEKLWDCDRLDEFYYRIFRNNIDDQVSNKWLSAFQTIIHVIFNLQNRYRSKEVAEKHYNLGNQFYRCMLGKTLAYSCAYWKNADNLDQAQTNKFELICKKLYLKPGEKVLDIGCGWGTLAKYMADNYGCEVTGVNLSTEQVAYAKQINDKAKIFLCDYRDHHIYDPQGQKFDKLVSVGFLEHVGTKNYASFLKLSRELLKEDGLFLLHSIGKNTSTLYPDPWIDKYIFPHGILPSLHQLSVGMEGTFVLEDLHNFGADYDKTLMAWHANFNRHWEQDLASSYNETFFRMWNYYLLSCAAGFRARARQLWQMVLSPKGVLGGYTSVR